MTDTAGLIMAGGRSSRMRSGGCATHKGLRGVGGAPLIEWNLRALLAHGFRDLFVAVNATEPELLEWVDQTGRGLARSQGAQLELLVETEALGTIGAAGTLPHRAEGVLVVNVDNLTRLNLSALVRFHREQGAAATIATHRHPVVVPFGVLELDGPRVRAYREKPPLSVSISSGTYVLGKPALQRARQADRLDAPQLMQMLLDEGLPVAAFAHEADWIDVNDEAQLARAQQLFGRNEAVGSSR